MTSDGTKWGTKSEPPLSVCPSLGKIRIGRGQGFIHGVHIVRHLFGLHCPVVALLQSELPAAYNEEG